MKMPNPSMIKGSMMMKYIVSFPNILVKMLKQILLKIQNLINLIVSFSS